MLRSTNENVILCGDFNLDLMKIDEDAASSSVLDRMNMLTSLPIITKPPRITDSSCTLIVHELHAYRA